MSPWKREKILYISGKMYLSAQSNVMKIRRRWNGRNSATEMRSESGDSTIKKTLPDPVQAKFCIPESRGRERERESVEKILLERHIHVRQRVRLDRSFCFCLCRALSRRSVSFSVLHRRRRRRRRRPAVSLVAPLSSALHRRPRSPFFVLRSPPSLAFVRPSSFDSRLEAKEAKQKKNANRSQEDERRRRDESERGRGGFGTENTGTHNTRNQQSTIAIH